MRLDKKNVFPNKIIVELLRICPLPFHLREQDLLFLVFTTHISQVQVSIMSGHGHSPDGGLGGCYHGLAANVGGDAGIACRLCDQ